MSKKTIPTFLLTIGYLLFTTTSPAYAAPWTAPCVFDTDVATLQGISCLFANLISIMLQLIGVASFIMLIIGGFKVLSFAGNPEDVEAGKKTLAMAVGGLIFALIAWFILKFIEDFTGVPVTIFSIPSF